MSFKPENTPQLFPYMIVQNAKRSVDFYKKAFGFIEVEIVKDSKDDFLHVSMQKGDALIMFCQEGAYDNTKKSPRTLKTVMPINMYVYCEDTDKLYDQAIVAGAKSLIVPKDSFWGDRFCSVLDIDDYEWSFATLLQK
jgi:PhnB protein